MPTIEQLTAWLKAPRYNEGVELYAGLTSSSAYLVSLFRKGFDNYNSKKLTALLQTELESLLLSEQKKQDEYPSELKTDLARGKQLMDIRQALKQQCRSLFEAATERGNTLPDFKNEAFRILDIGDELTAIYGKKRFVDKNGYLPEPPTHDGDPVDALINRRNTVRTYVSRLKKKYDAASDDACRETIRTRLAGFQSEILDIENRLASYDN